MPTQSRPIFRFGRYELVSGLPALFREGQQVSITPKALATLKLLVEHVGSAVSKEELMTTVWSDTAVEESSLSQNIYTLRKLLAPDFPDKNPIENIPRFGYRFTLPVTLASPAEGDPTLQSETFTPAASKEPPTTAIQSGSEPPAVPFESAVEPSERRQRSAELQETLHQATRRWVIAISLLALVSLLSYLLWAPLISWFRPPARFSISRFTSNLHEDKVTAVGLSPDGKIVAYADADGIVLRGVHDLANYLLPSPPLKMVTQISWFPDQLHLLVSGISADAGKAEVWRVSVLREPPTLFRSNARLAVVSPSGSSVALTTGDGSEVWVMGTNGENSHRVLKAENGARFSLLLWALHDDALLLQRRPGGLLDSSANGIEEGSPGGPLLSYLHLRLRDGQITTTRSNFVMGSACLLSNGDLLYSDVTPEEGQESISIRRATVNPVTGELGTSKDFYSIPDEDLHFYGFSCSSVGDRLAVVRIQGAISVFVGDLNRNDTELTNVRQLSLDSIVAYPHAWSRDSRSVWYEAARTPLHWQIYAQSLDRHDPEPAFSMSGSEARPTFTPDGEWLLFNYQEAPFGKHVLYRIKPKGGNPTPVPAQEDLSQFRCPFLAGTCIVSTTTDDGQRVFSRLDPLQGKGPEVFRVSQGSAEVQDWDISPDGTHLVFTTPSSDKPIHTVALANRNVSDVPYHPASTVKAVNWAADGRSFFIALRASQGDDLFRVTQDGKATFIRAANVGTWAVPSPDGKHIAFIDRNLDSNVWLLSKQ